MRRGFGKVFEALLCDFRAHAQVMSFEEAHVDRLRVPAGPLECITGGLGGGRGKAGRDGR